MIGWRFGGDPSPLLRDVLELVQESRRGREGGGEPMPVNVHEADNEVVVEALLPAVRPEDVEIQGADGVLTIRAESTIEEREYAHQEIVRHTYLRRLALPADCKLDEARAEAEHGVLTIRVPIARPKPPERIRIEVNRSKGAAPIDAQKGQDYAEVEAPKPPRRPAGRKPAK